MIRRSIVFVLAALVVGALATVLAQQYGEWEAPVRLAWGVNTEGAEMNPFVSRDGLTIYFLRTPGTATGGGYWVAHRATVDDPWDPPVYVGDLLGDGVFVTSDGHRAYFALKTAAGTKDLFVSRRQDQDDDFGWGPPESLGSTVNGPSNEHVPSLYEDEATGTISLYFASDRPGGQGGDDIYVSVLQEDGTFGEPLPVPELSSDAIDRQVKIRRDGLECVLMSNRGGSMPNQANAPSLDIWIATRASVFDAWSQPVNAGPGINTGRAEGFPSYSFDGSQLFFHAAMRPGNFDPGDDDPSYAGCPFSSTCYFDIWVAKRPRVGGRPAH